MPYVHYNTTSRLTVFDSKGYKFKMKSEIFKQSLFETPDLPNDKDSYTVGKLFNIQDSMSVTSEVY